MNATATTKISFREREIIRLVSLGKTSKQISTELFISSHTVQSHRKNVMAKLGAHNFAHMVRMSIETGLLHLTQNENQ